MQSFWNGCIKCKLANATPPLDSMYSYLNAVIVRIRREPDICIGEYQGVLYNRSSTAMTTFDDVQAIGYLAVVTVLRSAVLCSSQ